MSHPPIEEGFAFLAGNGLNMVAVAALEAIPREFIADVEREIPGFADYRSLIMIGNAGTRLWEAIFRSRPGPDPAHPINTFTRHVVEDFISRYLADESNVTIFPHPTGILPMQKIGEWLGWVHPSPIGVGIHAEYGLWHAYRWALLTTGSFEQTPRVRRASPCDSCEKKPCIAVCPAGAVKDSTHRMATFDVKSCAEYRLGEPTLCRDRCLSRLACPVGREHRYPMAMMNHAYNASLPKMAGYLQWRPRKARRPSQRDST